MYISNTGNSRPNRLERKKDSAYDAEYTRYCLGTLSEHTYRNFVNKSLINWSFFKGGDGQWIFEEDIEAFFLDESGDVRNRLKWSKNMVKPMVQQYVGNSIRLSFDCKAENISEFVINKREEELKRLKGYQKLVEQYPSLKEVIEGFVELGENEMETQEIFDNSFVEEYETDINNLIEFISGEVNIDELKVQITRNLALSGLGVYKGYEANGNYMADAVNPLFFFWDMSAIKPDLSDAEYQGEWYYMDAPLIFERYPKLHQDQREAIEKASQNETTGMHKVLNNIFTIQGGKVPVYEVYWKDVEKKEFGWVMDDLGYPYYTLINDEDSIYTDKDLIEPQTEEHKESMDESKKHTIYPDVLRYCIMIAKEDVAFGEDIVLESGVLPYGENGIYDPTVKFPYKCYTWVYDRGEVLTPLDDVIDPQRFLNRTMSVVESHMSNMRGTGTVISKSAVDDSEAETTRNINASKPIYIDTDRVGSVGNAIGTYGTNIGGGTLQMFQVIDAVQQSIQDVTGVNESMTGTGQGGDMLVGVVEAQIQRGSLVQEPFYWALTSILKQAYESMATKGKSIYIDNPRKLAIMTGDKGLVRINLTKDYALQDFRIKIKRAETKEQGIAAGNQLLFTLLQAQLLDQPRFANLFGRANPEAVAQALREYHKEKLMAQYQKDKIDAQIAEQASKDELGAAQAIEQQIVQDKGEKIEDKILDHELEMDKIKAKGEASGVAQMQGMMNGSGQNQ